MKKLLVIVGILSLLTGCWDKTPLNDIQLADLVAIDKVDKDSKQLKLSLLVSRLLEAHQGGGKPSTILVSASGSSLSDANSKASQSIPGYLGIVQCRLYLLSKTMAKDHPMKALNVVGRFPEDPLVSHIAVYDGDMTKLLAKKKIKEQTVNDFMVSLLETEGKRNNVPDETLIHFILSGEAFLNDFALPRFSPKGDGVALEGSSLFRDGSYTGQDLSTIETRLALLMKGAQGAGQQITGLLNQTPYSIVVRKAKRNIVIHSNGNKLQDIEISVKIDVSLVEFSAGSTGPMSSSKVNKLEKEISADLTREAAKSITAMQRVNSDYMQLGHELHAYHPKLWKQLNWRKEYPQMTIRPKISIRKVDSGVIVP